VFKKGEVVRLRGTDELYVVRNLAAIQHQVVKLRSVTTGKRMKIAGTRLERMAAE
jgi:hypothetical protein